MAIFFNAAITTGGATDDFMIGHPGGGAKHMLDGGDGRRFAVRRRR